MTRFLASPSLDTLLADLAQHGFSFDTVEPFQFASNGTDTAIYLGHVPIQTGTDEEGNPIMGESTDFCANVTACEGLEFETEIPAPETPYNIFV